MQAKPVILVILLLSIMLWGQSDRKGEVEDGDLKWKDLRVQYLQDFTRADTTLWTTGKHHQIERTMTQGAYCWHRFGDRGSIKYFHMGLENKDIAEAPVSLEVLINYNPNYSEPSEAGLLYRFNKRQKTYYIFTISASHQVYFSKRHREGLDELYVGESYLIRRNKKNKLGIIGIGNRFHLYINDVLVKVVRDDELDSGITGLITIGSGEFCFDNLTIYTSTDVVPR